MTKADLALLRETRLRALRDSPRAFGSTYAQEVDLTDQEWCARLKRFCDPSLGAGFLALAGSENPGERGGPACCGLIGCVREDVAAQRVHIVSMWVAPEFRRRAVGSMLMAAAESWAAAHGLAEIALNVVDDNTPAVELYRRSGFEETGEWKPYSRRTRGRACCSW